ncbi:MAG: sortase [Patescibacteria group bacterium]|nr:sortase [Patescibacteria group bacterium]
MSFPTNSLITEISGHSISDNQDISTPITNSNLTENQPLDTKHPETSQDIALATATKVQSSTEEFYLVIPKINLTKDITANVDPTNSDEYLEVIETNIAHGMYTALPTTSTGNTYLFAHSKRYYDGTTPDGGWFTRIDELSNGDVIYIYYNGNSYKYIVANTLIVSPTDVAVYSGISPFGEQRALTLQTCYPRGNTGQRLIIQARGE